MPATGVCAAKARELVGVCLLFVVPGGALCWRCNTLLFQFTANFVEEFICTYSYVEFY